MSRSTTSSLLSTAQLALLMVGVPIWLFSRLTSAILPLQALDLILALGIAAWLIVGAAIMNRDRAIDSLAFKRTMPAAHAARLVDNSILGVGFEPNATPASAPPLHLLAAPAVITEADLPPRLPAAEFAQGRITLGEAGPRHARPELHSDEPAALGNLATREYRVARGDTFWSIAETVLGDGRDWQQLQQLNLGREVAPGLVLNETHDLRIGWSVLLPATELDSGAAESHVA